VCDSKKDKEINGELDRERQTDIDRQRGVERDREGLRETEKNSVCVCLCWIRVVGENYSLKTLIEFPNKEFNCTWIELV